ncbi:two-component regulator propeller domain-containing protein [Pontibacter sp. G13]|uniref:hybrid sensor histidine kinase/response regulator transcription factor n=1 Tax=Pontibacter sp. G13 TaxID=3074898 RepID=UPI00288BA9C8|nr:two-component regulator propeller domain-containing protein [Pontibacter sp. G13]WNJ17532.1 two-component regulator propeller domain-containing protein [Pontibacter sp. G13]
MRFFLWALAIWLSLPVARANPPLKFHQVLGNLSQHTITTIHEDRYGFIWCGTRHGLNKFDGLRFNAYFQDGSSNSIPHNYLKDSHATDSGFWMATSGGFSFFDYRTQTFEHWLEGPKDSLGLTSDLGVRVLEARSGQVWMATERGLNLLSPDRSSIRHLLHDPADLTTLSDNFVTSVAEDSLGGIWVGTLNAGLNHWLPASQSFRRIVHFPETQEPMRVRCMESGKSHVWVGTEHGVIQLSPQGKMTRLADLVTGALSQVLNASIVLSLMEDDMGKLWVGTERNGLIVVDLAKGKGSIYPIQRTPLEHEPSYSIWSLFQDRNGIVWIGTFNGGLFKVDPYLRQFPKVQRRPGVLHSLSYDLVSSFAEEPDGTLWIGTDGGGLNRQDLETGQFEHFVADPQDAFSIPTNAVISLLQDQDGDLWIGTYSGGVARKRQGSNRFERFPLIAQNQAQYHGADVFDLMEDDRGNIWIGTHRNGVFIFLKAKNEFVRLVPDDQDSLAITGRRVQVLMQDTSGAFWLGAENAGMDRIWLDETYRIIRKQHYQFDSADSTSLSSNTLTRLFQDSKGRVWITTLDNGLNLYLPEADEFRRFGMEDGLPSNMLFSIEEDLAGNLWISSNAGLSSMNADFQFENFDELDGLQSAEFIRNASLRSRSGELLFGGIQGFNRFDPAQIQHNPNPPPVLITGFQVLNAPEAPHWQGNPIRDRVGPQPLQLSHDQHDFGLQFSVLNFTQPSKNLFAYRLDPYEDQWNYPENGYNIQYLNVPPGTYTFRVRGANNDGVWNGEEDRLRLLISPPWWHSAGAYALYGLLLLGALLISRNMLLTRERLKGKLALEQLNLAKTQELSELKSRFFANISHEFRTPLTLILGPLSSLMDRPGTQPFRRQLGLMHHHARGLLDLVNEILQLAKLESGSLPLQVEPLDVDETLRPWVLPFFELADQQDIQFQCVFLEAETTLYADREKLQKILTNLLSNAFKYTPEFGKIHFRAKKSGTRLILEVEDSGPGISVGDMPRIFDRFYHGSHAASGTGIGLALVKELVDMHQGKIEVESQAGKGTIFRVDLRLGSEHFAENLTSEPAQDQARLGVQEWAPVHSPIRSQATEVLTANAETPAVLIVEDHTDMREFLQEILQPSFQVLEARDGVQAWMIIERSAPDLIISDAMMPEMDGFELCRQVKTTARTAHIPFVMLTAKSSPEGVQRGIEHGADLYLTKPFEPRILQMHLDNLLRNRARVRDHFLHGQDVKLTPEEIRIAPQDRAFLDRVVRVIESHIGDSELGIELLCRELGTSKTQLYRKMKALVGQSANEFIRSFRLKHAANLLKSGGCTVGEAVFQSGFNDPKYFREAFKRQFGVNPSVYRRQFLKS